MPDAIETLARHAAATRHEDLPDAAVQAAKTFILDSLGVGVAGSAGPHAGELVAAARGWGRGEDARVWAHGARLPAPAAALLNAYQMHNSEFDAIHERAVVHAMTPVLAAAVAEAERTRGVSGRELILAAALGVDVACHIAVGARTGLRFFRPGTCGAFGAATAIGVLRGFSADTLLDAYGAVLAQLSGTMQAHTEGSALLGLQMGFSTRNAFVACDLAGAGVRGPRGVLEGRFGYYALFEGAHEVAGVLPEVGRVWRVAELAHKPFPSGRATHGIVDAVLALQRAYRFDSGSITRVECRVPPLVHHLVGRPPRADMAVNYARLCAAWVAARALEQGTVGVGDFAADRLADPATLALADRFAIEIDSNPDPNALSPVAIAVTLADGARHETRIEAVIGSPAKPLDRAAQLAKLRANWQAAARPLAPDGAERLIELVDGLESVADVRELVDVTVT